MTLLEKEWYIQVPWGRICILAWGNCHNSPVLLCHGSMDSAASFRPLVKLLPKNYYYIGMEFPGNGKSDRFPSGLMISPYDMVYAVEAVVKHFRWETFVYVGHSLGAVIGKFYNISCPGKISKLIELDPINFSGVAPEHFAEWYEKYFVKYYENYEKYNMAKEKAPKIKWKDAIATLKKNRGLTDGTAAATLERWSEPAGKGLIRYTFDQRIKLIPPPPFTPDHIKTIFTNVKTPILNIIAANSTKNGLYRNTAFLLDENAYPAGNFRMRTVSGGHDVHVVDPDRVASFVAQFLVHGLDGLDTKAKL